MIDEIFWKDWVWLILLALIQNEASTTPWTRRVVRAVMVFAVFEACFHAPLEAALARWL